MSTERKYDDEFKRQAVKLKRKKEQGWLLQNCVFLKALY